MSTDTKKNRARRARRALERQLEYQQLKSKKLRGREREAIQAMKVSSAQVRSVIEAVRPIGADARVIEVGSGAHGLIFYFGEERRIGLDPLAWQYSKLFAAWQQLVPTVAAAGEDLPFADESFDVVLCDNVVDHAESPERICRELVRILAPSGMLYFTVNIHHPIYAAASVIHGAWNAAGVHFEVGPFADHTVHLTLESARRLFRDLPLRLVEESWNIAETKQAAKKRSTRHAGDRLKRIFFKNATYRLIASKE